MVSTTGWNAVNSISGASVLNALSDGKCPTWLGVVIICTTVWVICALGIRWIHQLDAFLWIPPFVVWCFTAGYGASHFSGDAIKTPSGANGAAAALSFIAVIFSFAVSWINCAADVSFHLLPARVGCRNGLTDFDSTMSGCRPTPLGHKYSSRPISA